MQILPDFLTRVEDTLSSLSGSVSDTLAAADDFQHELNRMLDNAAAQKAADEALADSREQAQEDAEKAAEAARLAAAPYDPTRDLHSPFAPGEVRFTAAEVERLVEGMGEDRVSGKALEALQEAGRMPGGATAQQLIEAARKALETQQAALSDQEKAHLQSLSRKLFGKDNELTSMLKNGTARNALGSILAGLEGSNAGLSVTSDEMAALAKALGLSGTTTNNLLGAFGEKSMLSLTGHDLRLMLDQAFKELDTAQAEMEKMMASLEQRMAPIMKDAKQREELERMTGMLEDRAVARSRTLIRDNATQSAPGREDVVDQDKQRRAVSRNAEDMVERRNLAQADAERQTIREESRSASRDNDARRDWNSREGNSREGRPTEAAPLSASTSPSPAAQVPSGLQATMSQGVGQLGAEMAGQQNAPLPSALSDATLEQIDQAILTAFRNGTQRLEVALNPVALGTMTVILTSRNGEISALIQPERAETAALITQQAEQIRQQLENQGFRVEKVEVQTQLADQQSQHGWQGMEQHNASRDMADRAGHLERLRLLGRLSGNSASLARDMQVNHRTATVAAQGLHIIA